MNRSCKGTNYNITDQRFPLRSTGFKGTIVSLRWKGQDFDALHVRNETSKRLNGFHDQRGSAVRHGGKVVWPKVQSDFSLQTTGKSWLIRWIREHFRELSGNDGFAKCRAIMELYPQSQLHRRVSDRQWCPGSNSYLIHNDVVQWRGSFRRNGKFNRRISQRRECFTVTIARNFPPGAKYCNPRSASFAYCLLRKFARNYLLSLSHRKPTSV